MKKLFATVLILLYIIPAIGINVSVHFCGGEQASVSYFKKQDRKCLCPAEAEKKSCCEDRYQILKIDDTQQKAEFLIQKFSNPFHAVFTIPADFKPVVPIESAAKASEFFGSPYLYKSPLYLLNRVLRI